MTVKRIVSFFPSATELLYELGVGDKVFGVTHECLYPENAKTKPRVINSVFDPNSNGPRREMLCQFAHARAPPGAAHGARPLRQSRAVAVQHR